MSRYVAMVQIAGKDFFLRRGRLTTDIGNATHYPHPSGARRAALTFRVCLQSKVTTTTIDRRSR